jgi:hypothetical protein
MKPFFHHLLTAALLVFIGGAGGAAAEPAISPAPSRILFIGNSYTGVNKLPQIFQQIVASAVLPAPEVKSATPGGRTLAKHLEEAESLKLIDEGRWDVVVLQGQSQEAAKPEPIGNHHLRGGGEVLDPNSRPRM